MAFFIVNASIGYVVKVKLSVQERGEISIQMAFCSRQLNL
jgi:hypothetical protein